MNNSMLARVDNMVSPRTGNKVANQFIITQTGGIMGNFIKRDIFQSYDSVIAIKTVWQDNTEIELDKTYWDYSVTTGKYRNQFLGETKKETERKIKEGIYKLVDLN